MKKKKMPMKPMKSAKKKPMMMKEKDMAPMMQGKKMHVM